mgnify:FL=1
MLKQYLTVILSTFVFVGSQAGAQCTPETAGQQGPGKPTYAEFDLDSDGKISSEEYYQARGARMAKRAQAGGKMKNAGNMPSFETIDLDGDGFLSSDEFAAHHQERSANHGQGKHKNRP